MFARPNALLRRAVHHLRQARSRACTRRALGELNPRALLDIGLERDDIDAVVRGRATASLGRGEQRVPLSVPTMHAVSGSIATVHAESSTSRAA